MHELSSRREPALPSPPDPGFAARVRASFERQSLMRTIGASLRSVDAGEVMIDLDPVDGLTQQHGYLHAGIVTSIMDTACGYAAYTLMPADADVLSVEFKVNLLAPSAGRQFVARARVLRTGRTLTVVQGDVFASDASNERHVATMLATMMRVDPRPVVEGADSVR